MLQKNNQPPTTDLTETGKIEEIQETSLALNEIVSILDPDLQIVERLTDQYAHLLVNDPNQPPKISEIKKAMTAVNQRRLGISKNSKEVAKRISNFKKLFDEEANKFISPLVALYESLKEVKLTLELAAASAKKIETDKKLEAYQSKVDKLMKAGFLSDQVQLVVGALSISHASIEHMEDAEVDRYCELAKKEVLQLEEFKQYKAMQERKKEIEKTNLGLEELSNKAKKNAAEIADNLKEQPEIVHSSDTKGGEATVIWKEFGNATNLTKIDSVETKAVVSDDFDAEMAKYKKEKELPIGEETKEEIPDLSLKSDKDEDLEIGDLPAGFSLGWSACKNAVLNLFHDENKRYTREDLIAAIEELKAD